ncbi:MAG: nucleoside-diphosphate kinase [Patescibacteria group bacterium]
MNAKHPKQERTLIILKPDAIQRSLIGDIINRFERTGLKFTGFKFLIPTEAQCFSHYHKDETWCREKGERVIKEREEKGKPIEKSAVEYGKDIVGANVHFLTSGPVLAMVLMGNKAIGVVKKIVGGTEPLTSDVGTIRGDLTIDSYDLSGLDERAVRNLIHCSDSVKEAEREIPIWFKENELIAYRLVNEVILYDTNLDGILD